MAVADGDVAPNDGERAWEAITAVARLKISGTAAGKGYDWTAKEVRLAEKAETWLRMFVRHARRRWP